MPAPAFAPPPLGVGTVWNPLTGNHGLPVVEVALRHTRAAARAGFQPRLVHGEALALANRHEALSPRLTPWLRAADGVPAQADAAGLPAWFSAPLAFTHVAGLGAGGGAIHAGTALPALQCAASVLTAVRRIEQLRRATGRPVALRNLFNPLRPQAGEWSDGDYLAAVAEAAGCGIDLDITALRAGEARGRNALQQVLQRLPRHRVWSVRLASPGGDGSLQRADLALLADWMPVWSHLGAVVLVDTQAEATDGAGPGAAVDPEPRAEAIEATEALHALWASHLQGRSASAAEGPAVQRSAAGFDPAHRAGPRCSVDEWERALAGLVNGVDPKGLVKPSLQGLPGDPGIAELRARVLHFRRRAVQQGLPLSWQALVQKLGLAQAQALQKAFWQQHWPASEAVVEARHFAQFLRVSAGLKPAELRSFSPLLDLATQLDTEATGSRPHPPVGAAWCRAA